MNDDMTLVKSIYASVRAGEVDKAQELIRRHPDYKSYSDAALVSWLHLAARSGSVEMVQLFLNLGLDANKIDHPAETSPLIIGIDNEHLDVVRFLLDHGADPNLGRPLIAAINIEDEDRALEFVKLLVEHGADVNRVFTWYGDDRITFTPLTWAEDNEKWGIVGYLQSKGAAQPTAKPPAKSASARSLSESVVAYFEEHFGQVRPKALIEVVPSSEPPIAIHVIPPGMGRTHVTLFTAGLSDQPMTVPPGQEAYRFAELYIQLPANWPTGSDAPGDPQYGWPYRWLRQIASYPHKHRTWLGGPATVIANGDPPEPIATGLPFTALLLLAEREFSTHDGRRVHLYRMLPLHTAERDYELKHGIAPLMRAFDRSGVSAVFDPKRPNAVKR